jgi:hypothetical protein
VVIAVKLIYWTGIGNDVMDESGLMESLLNSIKPLHVVNQGHPLKGVLSRQISLPGL